MLFSSGPEKILKKKRENLKSCHDIISKVHEVLKEGFTMLKLKVSHPKTNLILVIEQRNKNKSEKKYSKEPVTSVTSLFELTLFVCISEFI